jgi:hypothetical protein
VNKGRKYIIKQLAPPLKPDEGLIFESFQYGPQINALEVYEMHLTKAGIVPGS